MTTLRDLAVELNEDLELVVATAWEIVNADACARADFADGAFAADLAAMRLGEPNWFEYYLVISAELAGAISDSITAICPAE